MLLCGAKSADQRSVLSIHPREKTCHGQGGDQRRLEKRPPHLTFSDMDEVTITLVDRLREPPWGAG